MVDAPAAQTHLRNLERLAARPEQVIAGNADILKRDIAVTASPRFIDDLQIADEPDARRIRRDDECRHSPIGVGCVGIGHRERNIEIGKGCVCREPFLA
ncbi:MAG: hypothetical protein Q7T73_09885, partial [Beijerinckiaceae bacterium]|nr:hypothetical protein [Beijerinckiaceae bacterium]